MVDESEISPAQSRVLGDMGKTVSEVIIMAADEFVADEELSHPNSRGAAVFTILEATLFLTLTKMCAPENRAGMLRILSISTRQALANYHKDTGR